MRRVLTARLFLILLLPTLGFSLPSTVSAAGSNDEDSTTLPFLQKGGSNSAFSGAIGTALLNRSMW